MTFVPPLWSLTLNQVLDLPVATTLNGTKLRPKEDPNNAAYCWRGDVDLALMLKLPVPSEVISSRQHNEHPITSPNILVNVKGRPFTWSPSSLANFLQCPAQYAAKRFYCTVVEQETEAMRAGTIEHKHLENRLKDKTPLPNGFTRGEAFCQAIERTGGEILAELELALTADLKFVPWFAKDAWGRCKVDVALRLNAGQKVNAYDFKTGTIKEDMLQLKINLWMLSLKYPEAEEFAARFVWLKHSKITPAKGQGGEFTKSDMPAIKDEILELVGRMKKAWEVETFVPRSSGLCRAHCPVTTCVHNGRR